MIDDRDDLDDDETAAGCLVVALVALIVDGLLAAFVLSRLGLL